MYGIFLIAAVMSMTTAMVALFLRARLVWQRRATLHSQIYHILAKAGYSVTTGQIAYALYQNGGTSSSDARIFVFVAAFVTCAVGFLGMSLQAMDEVSVREEES